ncbi:MAG: tRNA threonylcarbamoyladenosine dehydratase [Deltaproteobacteria bacterium]|nr:tRNA threonylcarbamoyladenosine dehydratase [Deltaproteobacteria bacterium]
MHAFQRTELLVGRDAWQRIAAMRVMVVGIGGVGSFAAEALARAGVGHIALVDFDQVCLTNLNRQIHATRKTVGASKVALMADRCRSINPRATVVAEQRFFDAASSQELLLPGYDCVVDCIDNVTAKVALLSACVARGQRVVSAMGAGGRVDPTRVRVTDISRTEKDPLAKVVRNELRARGVHSGIECAWTDEEPADLDHQVADEFHCICPWGENDHHSCSHRNVVQGTVPWMPAIFGMMLAGVAINRRIGQRVLSSDRARPSDQPRRKKQRASARVARPLPG